MEDLPPSKRIHSYSTMKEAVEFFSTVVSDKDLELAKALYKAKSGDELLVLAAANGVKKLTQKATFLLCLFMATEFQDWLPKFIDVNAGKRSSLLSFGHQAAVWTMQLHQCMVKTDKGREAFHILFDCIFYGYWVFQAPY